MCSLTSTTYTRVSFHTSSGKWGYHFRDQNVLAKWDTESEAFLNFMYKLGNALASARPFIDLTKLPTTSGVFNIGGGAWLAQSELPDGKMKGFGVYRHEETAQNSYTKKSAEFENHRKETAQMHSRVYEDVICLRLEKLWSYGDEANDKYASETAAYLAMLAHENGERFELLSSLAGVYEAHEEIPDEDELARAQRELKTTRKELVSVRKRLLTAHAEIVKLGGSHTVEEDEYTQEHHDPAFKRLESSSGKFMYFFNPETNESVFS
jgi:hypothetical protein